MMMAWLIRILGHTPIFWRRTRERAIRAAANAALAMLTATAFTTDRLASWKALVIAAGVAALVSVLTSLAGSRVGDPESPSLLREE